MRIILALIAGVILAGALMAGGATPNHPQHHYPATFGNGCDVSLTIPNPCDPDSNN